MKTLGEFIVEKATRVLPTQRRRAYRFVVGDKVRAPRSSTAISTRAGLVDIPVPAVLKTSVVRVQQKLDLFANEN